MKEELHDKQYTVQYNEYYTMKIVELVKTKQYKIHIGQMDRVVQV